MTKFFPGAVHDCDAFAEHDSALSVSGVVSVHVLSEISARFGCADRRDGQTAVFLSLRERTGAGGEAGKRLVSVSGCGLFQND